MRLLAAITIVLAASAARGQALGETRPVGGADMQAAFDLLGSLDAPATLDCPLIEVTGRQQRGQRDSCTTGFLIQEDETSFAVWFLDLELERFAKDGRVRIIRKSFEDEAPRLFAFLADLRVETGPDPYPGVNDSRPMTIRTELISLARECSLRQRDELSRHCCETAAALGLDRGPRRDLAPSLVETVRLDVETAWMRRAVVACGDPAVQREELAAAFARCERYFPDGRWNEHAAEMRSELERMVKEDREHGPPRPTNVMSLDERIEELIFQMRDQVRVRSTSRKPTAHSIRPWDGSASGKLVVMGEVAVPRLIAAIGDRRLTRTVRSARRSGLTQYVVRIGDCAIEILEQITGLRYGTTRWPDYYLQDTMAREADARNFFLRWWEEKHPAPASQSRAAESRR